MKSLQGLENLQGPGSFSLFWPFFTRKGNETGIMSRGVHSNSDVSGTSVDLGQPVAFSHLEGDAKSERGPSYPRAAW